MLSALSVFWAFLKKYWAIGLAVLTFVVAVIMRISAESRVAELTRQLADAEERHKKDLESIKNAHDTEISERDQHIVDLEKTLKSIEEKYAADAKKLEDDKKKEIARLISLHGDDIELLTEKLSEVTGIPVVVSTKDSDK